MTNPTAELLAEASRRSKTAAMENPFQSRVFGDEWDQFVETWAPIIYSFLYHALGPTLVEPNRTITAMHEGAHASGANASYMPGSGDIQLCPSVCRGKPGTILEKLTHEMTHASLDGFPEGDAFYEEGVVDYSVWCMAHAPIWGEHREAMIQAAAFNIAQRRERAFRDLSDYDRKRWAGGLFAATVHGPYIVAKLRMRKAEGDLRW